MFRKIGVFAFVFCLCFVVKGVFAQDLTLEVVKAKVLAAAKLIEEEGTGAFSKLKDPNGEFRFGDGKGYVWVHSLNGQMIMHPTRPELERTDMLNDKDSSGFPFIYAMNQLVEKRKQGWVVYLWPKPGKKIEEIKASFVRLARNQGKDYVVGCGMYAASADYVRSAFPGDAIYDSTNFFGTPQLDSVDEGK
ncbi:MAG: cache domain-containing protein [Candidatus Omnitrophica bacterium]|nr:cache domain-containing protein [Candidatus Omnitrophota bacterium]